MKLIQFKGQTTVVAENQDEYLDMPARRYDDPQGHLVCCWQLSLKERLKLLFTGRLWHTILTFRQSVQPIALSTECPFKVMVCESCLGTGIHTVVTYPEVSIDGVISSISMIATDDNEVCEDCNGEGEIYE